jgi:hypothetical protein
VSIRNTRFSGGAVRHGRQRALQADGHQPVPAFQGVGITVTWSGTPDLVRARVGIGEIVHHLLDPHLFGRGQHAQVSVDRTTA